MLAPPLAPFRTVILLQLMRHVKGIGSGAVRWFKGGRNISMEMKQKVEKIVDQLIKRDSKRGKGVSEN